MIRALAVVMHEIWIEANRYLDMSLLAEMKKKAVMETGCLMENASVVENLGPSGNSVGYVFKLTSGTDRVRRRKNRSPS